MLQLVMNSSDELNLSEAAVGIAAAGGGSTACLQIQCHRYYKKLCKIFHQNNSLPPCSAKNFFYGSKRGLQYCISNLY